MTGITGKTGVVDTIDRETGKFMWTNPTFAQNMITHIDGTTGDVTENPEVIFLGPPLGAARVPELELAARTGSPYADPRRLQAMLKSWVRLPTTRV